MKYLGGTMKRNYLFVLCAFMIAGLSYGCVHLYSYFYPKQYEKNEDGEYINVNADEISTFPITENTTFTIEYYYSESDRVLTEKVSDIPALLGCDLDDTKTYLSNYMDHISVEEREDGLCSYELVSYSGQEVCLRKTFRKEKNSGFIVKSFNGMIVILNSDGKTVYEYTEINIGTLPEAMQDRIINGFEIGTEEELYSFLENYSS